MPEVHKQESISNLMHEKQMNDIKPFPRESVREHGSCSLVPR